MSPSVPLFFLSFTLLTSRLPFCLPPPSFLLSLSHCHSLVDFSDRPTDRLSVPSVTSSSHYPGTTRSRSIHTTAIIIANPQ